MPIKMPQSFSLLMTAILLLSACNPSFVPVNKPTPAQASDMLKALQQNHQQHPIVPSESDTDFAIDGVGYFAVLDHRNERLLFTRNGRFQRNANGQLITPEGFDLQPPITVPENTALVLSESGMIRLQSQDGASTEAGQLNLTRFLTPESLKAVEGLPGYFEPVPVGAPGVFAPEVGEPAQNGYGRVLNRLLEDTSQPLQAPADAPGA
ncbi:MAG: flagellar hook basal-body protein [Candidatus Sericytochromatia bacterium]|nr:flagellar hook basal-body protein [Candidatus Sericytochromatia bacterium]